MNGKGRTLRKQSQQLIYNLHNYFQYEQENGGPVQNINAVQQRVADALQISKKSVGKVVKRVNDALNNGTEISEPGTKRPRAAYATKDLDNVQKEAIRKVIYEILMYAKNEHITLKSLLEVLKERDIYNYSLCSLRTVLLTIGFEYKSDCNRKALVELEDIRSTRIKFLKEYHRNNTSGNMNVVFIGETWIFAKGGNINAGQDDSVTRNIKKTTGKGPRYFVIHAGGKKGFVQKAGLIFSSAKCTGAYHGDLSALNFEKWLQDMLLPNIKEPSLIIINNASYQTRMKDPSPTSAWKRQEIIDYLLKRGVEFSNDLFKPELLELAKRNSPPPIYVVDELVAAAGHKILRLPPFHSEFNPIEMIWSYCKHHYDNYIGQDEYGHGQVIDIWKQTIDNVTVNDWTMYVSYTEKIIKEWWERESHLDSLCDDPDPFIIHVGDVNNEIDASDDDLSD